MHYCRVHLPDSQRYPWNIYEQKRKKKVVTKMSTKTTGFKIYFIVIVYKQC